MASPSSFLFPVKPKSQPSSLSILHLSRIVLEPVILDSGTETYDGYQEGRVINTRFGSFPHSTLVDKDIGSQVRASNVDTGRRSRKSARSSRKRKRGKEGPTKEETEDGDQHGEEMLIDRSTSPSSYGVSDNDRSIREEAIEAPPASSGFAHLLPPTPELWTAALPHRTQVVYTPDYSYILQRLRVRPGSRIIESGAGSGSFTHAATRAVYDGRTCANAEDVVENDEPSQIRGHDGSSEGKVFSFEFHEQRMASVQREIQAHGLSDIVTVTHRDVYEDGFSIKDAPKPLHANAVFLDLPAPWLALPHLTRQASASSKVLNPKTSIHLCTFSPCIEQVQRTVSTLRSLGWVEISMVEVAAKRIEARRERVGLHEEGLRGANPAPANVEEALQRLKEVEGRSYEFHHPTQALRNGPEHVVLDDQQASTDAKSSNGTAAATRQSRIASVQAQSQHRKLYKEGRLVTRDEQVLKSHTSYLVFAILPREWTTEDELDMQRTLPTMLGKNPSEQVPLSKRAMKKQSKRG